jgi:hypothetical protein
MRGVRTSVTPFQKTFSPKKQNSPSAVAIACPMNAVNHPAYKRARKQNQHPHYSAQRKRKKGARASTKGKERSLLTNAKMVVNKKR